MKRLFPLLLPFILTAGLDLHAQGPRSVAGTTQRIVGTWQLMTRTVTRADGTAIVDPVLGRSRPAAWSTTPAAR